MTTTVSTKYQIVIPKEIRMYLKVTPGMKLAMTPETDGSIKLWPIKIKRIKELRGFAPGLNTDIEREPDREL